MTKNQLNLFEYMKKKGKDNTFERRHLFKIQ